MKIVLALLAWAAALAGGWLVWAASQIFQIRPGVLGAEGLLVVFAVWMTLEARKCG